MEPLIALGSELHGFMGTALNESRDEGQARDAELAACQTIAEQRSKYFTIMAEFQTRFRKLITDEPDGVLGRIAEIQEMASQPVRASYCQRLLRTCKLASETLTEMAKPSERRPSPSL